MNAFAIFVFFSTVDLNFYFVMLFIEPAEPHHGLSPFCTFMEKAGVRRMKAGRLGQARRKIEGFEIGHILRTHAKLSCRFFFPKICNGDISSHVPDAQMHWRYATQYPEDLVDSFGVVSPPVFVGDVIRLSKWKNPGFSCLFVLDSSLFFGTRPLSLVHGGTGATTPQVMSTFFRLLSKTRGGMT